MQRKRDEPAAAKQDHDSPYLVFAERLEPVGAGRRPAPSIWTSWRPEGIRTEGHRRRWEVSLPKAIVGKSGVQLTRASSDCGVEEEPRGWSRPWRLGGLLDSAIATTTNLAASACDRLRGWPSQNVATAPNGLDVILTAAGVCELFSKLAYEDVDDFGVRLVVQSAV
jgi:hypothetical protein